MYYLNTTRHLTTAATDDTIARLQQLLDEEIVPKASQVEGILSISWMISHDRLTLQAFSGWASAADAERAAHNPVHATNGVVINELLGGLASPQEHTTFELVGERSFG